jgi:hypothetical protein
LVGGRLIGSELSGSGMVKWWLCCPAAVLVIGGVVKMPDKCQAGSV